MTVISCSFGEHLTNSDIRKSEKLNVASTTESTDNSLIWEGRADSYRIVWDTKEVCIISAEGAKRLLLEPSVLRMHEGAQERVAKFIQEAEGSEREILVSLGMLELLSVVGTYVTFEVNLTGWVERYASTSPMPLSWITIDLNKPAKSDVFLDKEENIIGFPSQEVELSDFYSISEIVEALKVSPSLNSVLRGKSEREKEDLLRNWVDKGTPIEINENPHGINLMGFAFHSIEDDKIVLQIQVYELASNSYPTEFVEIKLPMIASLKDKIYAANSRKLGFLKKDLADISGGKYSSIKITSTVENDSNTGKKGLVVRKS